MAKRACCILISVALLAMVPHCTMIRQQLGMAVLPTQTEVQLGQELAEQVEQEEPVLPDAYIQNYVDGVFQQLVVHSTRDRPDIVYRVRVLDDPRQVNAFALPGGFIYVYTGLMLLAENEAELAGVLAHELGHVVARHSANRLATQMGVSLLTSIALGEEPGQLALLASQLIGASTMAAFSREDEREADLYGLRYAAAAGYDPRGLETFFEKLYNLEGGAQRGVFEGMLASHPDTRERIELLQRRIEQGGYTAGRLEEERYGQVLARLRRGYGLEE